ncbi:RNA-processing protein REF2 [Lachancea thermotolerans CBS 6340]|uniref:KLTH0F08360p n=1 Tax=Lachancea thermotolerans (strain ATCC 56472 / CBS 6340 / NRRL Y-8284) TaxID=559295 RepID=C5DKX8_LACTC|nr:KLTH0F08360p [Lachancea thermotolerans CBS 6340]CAR24129.1 KLTH0F08360p [Lachancea thermotolerans CBS 6340]
MSGSPIPQLVNISHALQSSFIQQLRTETREFSETPTLSQEQQRKIDTYIGSLERAFTAFTRDNEHIERRDADVTPADVQLYSGLKTMYADYLTQLTKLKRKSVVQNEASLRDQQKSANQSDNTRTTNPSAKKSENVRSSPQKEAVKTEAKAPSRASTTNEGGLWRASQEKNAGQNEHLRANQVLEYMQDELPYQQPAERKSYVDNLQKNADLTLQKNPKLLDAVANLAILDSTVSENLHSYVTLLRMVGYKDDEFAARLPHINGKLTPSDKALPPTSSADQASAKAPAPEEPKKKISFLKYLKKGDVNEQGKRVLEDNTLGGSQKRSRPNNDNNSNLISILKSETSKKRRNPIRFVADEKLLTVYGDDIPSDGLIVSPGKLKKVLKPFKDGEPREVTFPTWKNQKVRELSIPKPTEDSDIVDIKGGPISCDTRVSANYRLNFTAFSKSLNKQPLEPTELDEKDPNLTKKPLIVRAFGKNCLLLQKDRGGLPYKRVPEVSLNDYPIRPTSN